MTRTRNRIIKGFTLIELIVVIAIIGVLSGLLVPAIVGYVREAKINAVIADARTIKQSIEFSLMNNLAITYEDTSGAFNKVLYIDKDENVELVGGFTTVSWWVYKNDQKNNSKSQAVDKMIAGALDNSFSESWKVGKKPSNPMTYCTDTNNCAKCLKDSEANFAIFVLYDTLGSVRMMQLYRKGVLVTYINGEYLVNTSRYAHFVGKATWDKIYKDCGIDPPEGVSQIKLKGKQIGDNGQEGGWF